jgi:hypothetical protein
MHALQRDRSQRTVSAAHMAIALDQFCMRQGLASGALVVSHYVRSIFPYERAHEKGMGIVQEPSSVRPAQPSAAAGQAQDFEAKLFADELRALSQRPRAQPQIISLPATELVEEQPLQPLAADAAEAGSDRLGLDAFDEDLDVRPVVLLSHKRKNAEQRADGAFMSDLERRLDAEPPKSAEELRRGGSSEPGRSS